MLAERLNKIEGRYQEIEELLAQPDISSDFEKYQHYLKEQSGLKEIVEKYRALKKVRDDKEAAGNLLKETTEKDLTELAQQELAELEEKGKNLEKELEILLLPKDPHEEKNIFVEIRAGTGGEEAALFAADLLRMYLRYAEVRSWKTEIISENSTGLRGLKEVVIAVSGKGAYGRFKFESGTHRVQRVPLTEASGRIHTSAATVAVLPEAEDIDLKIDEKDLRIDTYRASGAGGQHVNKTSSAVRITHLPTGTAVACQDERSQHQNRVKAMRLLRSRLLAELEERQERQRAVSRKVQIGSGDRSEKIRTYNFPQGRVTDHRIGLSVHNMSAILDGDLDPIINALTEADRLKKLETEK